MILHVKRDPPNLLGAWKLAAVRCVCKSQFEGIVFTEGAFKRDRFVYHLIVDQVR